MTACTSASTACHRHVPQRSRKLYGPTTFLKLPGAVLATQQLAASLYLKAGQIPSKVNVTKEFDSRFNGLVAAEQGS